MKLLIGLGNPGNKYAANRHNVGFMVLDALAKEHTFPAWKEKFNALYTKAMLEGEEILLLKPQTYMNNSGQPARAAADFFKIPPADIIVIHDELDLPPLTIKAKEGGGHAGHNGLRSLHQHLGSPDYVRLRVGIGHPGHKDRVNAHVLSDFSKEEAQELAHVLPNLVQQIPHLWVEGTTAFMQSWTNKRGI